MEGNDPVAKSINGCQKYHDSTPASTTHLGDAIGNRYHQKCTCLADVCSLFSDLKFISDLPKINLLQLKSVEL